MRIAIVTASYPAFLRELYLNNSGLEFKPYSEQLAVRNDSLFEFADFYSRGFKAHGHAAAEFHLNNPWLQYAWARENGIAVPQPPGPSNAPAPVRRSPAKSLLAPLKPVLKPLARRLFEPQPPAWQVEVLRAQIEAFKPDIIYNQEPSTVRSRLLATFRTGDRHIVGQIASALPVGEDFRAYDLMISSLPNFVSRFRAQGVNAAYNRLAFETSVFDRVARAPERDIPLSFVGNLTRDHPERLTLLERVAEELPLAIWGSGLELLPAVSPLRKCHRGEAWGGAMYEILGRSRVTLNLHASFAGDHANNLRLYEATGMGALLLTDHKGDLDGIFAPGQEVVSYRDPGDCVAQARRLLADDAERRRIARTGQAKTFAVHNYGNRAAELSALFQNLIAGGAARR